VETDHTFWYLTRAAGLTAHLLLFSSVSLGLLLTGGLPRRLRRFQTYDLHRFVALLSLGVTIFHTFIVLPDQYMSFSVVEILVPFASPYETSYMAIGVVASYLLVAVVGSFYLRRLVSYRAWRLVHFSTFGVYGLALAHGIGAGTDSSTAWVVLLYVCTGVAVLLLALRRALFGTTRGLSSAIPRMEHRPGQAAR
jgi:predicted ferric reductase